MFSFFVLFFSLFLFLGQTRYDAITMATMYGEEYVDFPKYEKVALPEIIEGVWQGDDRYIFFNETEEERLTSNIALLLKTYYGWFYDRAAEPDSYAKDFSRYVCTATYPTSEKVFVSYEDLLSRPVLYDEDGNIIPYDSGAFELVVRFGEKQKEEVRIPVAIIGNNLYLDFLIRKDFLENISNEFFPDEKLQNNFTGVWHGVSQKKSIRVSPLPLNVNLYSYYVLDDVAYKIRYWPTTMMYTDAASNFTDGNETYHIAKHIVSDNVIFTNVTGKSTRIRNVEKFFGKENVLSIFADTTLSDDGMICAFGKPFLQKVVGKSNASDLIAIVEEANSRRKPEPAPLFPPKDLDWHWDLIALLEKDNEYIQEFRKNAFAKRAKKMQNPWYSSRLKLESVLVEE